MEKKKLFNILLPLVFYALLWEILAFLIKSPMLFPHISEVAKGFFKLFYDESFYISSFNTFSKAAAGFLCSLVLGSLSAFASSKNETFKILLRPLVSLMKSIPVTAYIIILFMWFESRFIPPVISFIAVFPIVYNNMGNAIENKNVQIYEMAEIYNITGLKKLVYLVFPEVFPFLQAVFKIGLPMSFKASVASEVITIATDTIGEHLYEAKIYFDMTELLAYAAALLIISFILERLVLKALGFLLRRSQEGFKWI